MHQILIEVHLVQYDDLLPLVEVELLINGSQYICPNEAEIFVRWGKKDRTYIYKKCIILSSKGEGNTFISPALYSALATTSLLCTCILLTPQR